MNQQTVANDGLVDARSEDSPHRQKTILIADDDPVVALSLSQRLQRLGYRIYCSDDATHALLDIEKLKPDLVILDIQMPAGNGMAVCEMLACNRQCVNIPIVVHSVVTDEAVKRRCRQFGTHYVEKSPRSAKEVETLVESLLGQDQSPDTEPSDTEPSDTLPVHEDRHDEEIVRKTVSPPDHPLRSVLCIDDDPVILRSIALRLEPHGIEFRGIDNGDAGYALAIADRPDLILLDLRMPTGAGHRTLEKLKNDPQTKDIPVIVLTMEATTGVQRQMFSLGADSFLTKPVHWPTLVAEMGRCVQLPKQLLSDYQLVEQLT